MPHVKFISQSDTGVVIASVYNQNTGNRVGLEFFHWPPFFQERRLQRAHRWADEWMKNCEKYCIDIPAQPSNGAKS